MEREVRYCTTEDGVRIAYCVAGDGPALIAMPPVFESFSLDDLYPAFGAFMSRLGEGRTLIRLDPRGSGRSQRAVDDMSVPALTRDIRAVANDLGLSTYSLYAGATGGPVIAAYAASYPDETAAIVLYGSMVRLPLPPGAAEGMAALARADWHHAARTIVQSRSSDASLAEANVQHTALLRASISGENIALAIEQFKDYDVTQLLGKIRARTLVLHRLNDLDVPFEHAEEYAAGVPGARLVPLKGTVNLAALEDPDSIIEAINKFLDAQPETRRESAAEAHTEARGSLRTVLFTDLVGHTDMMSRLGDQRGREVLREHERITRDVLKEHGGTEVKTMGDGFMASFGSVTKAVECAIALQRAFAEREGEPLSVRVGLNAGEPIEEEGDLFGATVILASRIAAKADGEEVLVSDNVRSLSAGKGFLFSDRGEFVAKGFDDPVRLFEVSWREPE